MAKICTIEFFMRDGGAVEELRKNAKEIACASGLARFELPEESKNWDDYFRFVVGMTPSAVVKRARHSFNPEYRGTVDKSCIFKGCAKQALGVIAGEYFHAGITHKDKVFWTIQRRNHAFRVQADPFRVQAGPFRVQVSPLVSFMRGRWEQVPLRDKDVLGRRP